MVSFYRLIFLSNPKCNSLEGPGAFSFHLLVWFVLRILLFQQVLNFAPHFAEHEVRGFHFRGRRHIIVVPRAPRMHPALALASDLHLSFPFLFPLSSSKAKYANFSVVMPPKSSLSLSKWREQKRKTRKQKRADTKLSERES